MKKFISNNTGIDNFVKNNSDATVARFGHLNAIVDNLNNNINSGTYTPTISDEVDGTATAFGDFLYTRIGDIVTVTGGFEFQLDGGETDGSFKFDLGALIQPNNNWASATEPITLLSRTSSFFNAECRIFGDVGSKLMDCAFADTIAGSIFKIFFSTTYKITN